ncbi:MAG: hypothetical protein KGJ23_00260 [Euryarchaeota archaeon]|nr:hypothetical protein [Euryarchaeota archaeon]MDE1835028.1 hypothetical protein [Euryarchaeota archaeon]MDE1882107.1 hypothetical protein [Euryarchaeota archaeon]MDE2044867.1 hypothetical protein [Thermoplasmata archaeon]
MKVSASQFSSALPSFLRPSEGVCGTWSVKGPFAPGANSSFATWRQTPSGCLVLTYQRLFMVPAAKSSTIVGNPVYYEVPVPPSFEVPLDAIDSVVTEMIPVPGNLQWPFLRVRWRGGWSPFAVVGDMSPAQRSLTTDGIRDAIQQVLPSTRRAAAQAQAEAQARIAALHRAAAPQAPPSPQVIVKEKETIREIVKVPCPYCSALVQITDKRCGSCGAPLTGPKARPPASPPVAATPDEAPAAGPASVCRACGEAEQEGAFCYSCGAKL